MHSNRNLLSIICLAAALASCAPRASEPGSGLATVVPNDNRSSAGQLRGGVLELDLVASLVRWEGEVSNLGEGVAEPEVIEVLAFAEEGEAPRIPGPMLRVPQGTEVRVRVRNDLPKTLSIGLPGTSLLYEGISSVAEDTLRVYGLEAGKADAPPLEVARGEVGELRYVADTAGTFFYWATPSDRPIESWTGVDAALGGAIVVDPPGTTPDPEERIFVITMIDQLVDEASDVPGGDYFRRAINGRSWPDTERLHYRVGEAVRWRWVNASFESHPMHLHGFHYRLLSRGRWNTETVFPEDETPLIVTEHMQPGSTFRMEWVPTRQGNWIVHCHFTDHVVPTVERSAEERQHEHHDAEVHALRAMAGLVVGVTVEERQEEVSSEEPAQKVQFVALEEPGPDDTVRRGFGVAREGEPEPTQMGIPGPPLVLTRDETTEIEVVNRLSEPTTIHWHGMELDSVYDGVAGWSRTRSRVAPLLAPGDRFRVRMRPPRAGSFMYHTHMDETEQLLQGMTGPLLVLEPGERFDPRTDRTLLITGQPEGSYPISINGRSEGLVEEFEAGVTVRLRLLHITSGAEIEGVLERDGRPESWTALAKDGADLPSGLRRETPAHFETHTGETYDYAWTPTMRGEHLLRLRYQGFFSTETSEVVAVFLVR